MVFHERGNENEKGWEDGSAQFFGTNFFIRIYKCKVFLFPTTRRRVQPRSIFLELSADLVLVRKFFGRKQLAGKTKEIAKVSGTSGANVVGLIGKEKRGSA